MFSEFLVRLKEENGERRERNVMTKYKKTCERCGVRLVSQLSKAKGICAPCENGYKNV